VQNRAEMSKRLLKNNTNYLTQNNFLEYNHEKQLLYLKLYTMYYLSGQPAQYRRETANGINLSPERDL
jgi:hypothetical protein